MRVDANRSLTRYGWGEAQIAALVGEIGKGAVADLGAGECRMRGVVEGLGMEWLGYDLHPLREDVRAWNLEEPGEPGWPSVKVALMLDVLEHLGNPWLAMRQVSRRIVRGGRLILTVPNPCWSRSRMWALRSGVPICFQQSDLDLNRHVFTPWPHIVERLLAESGFGMDRCETLDGPTRWPEWRWDLRYPVRVGVALVNRWMEFRDPWAHGMSYGVVAVKVRDV